MDLTKFSLSDVHSDIVDEAFDMGCGETLLTFDYERTREFCCPLTGLGWKAVKRFSLGDTDGTFYAHEDGNTMYVYTNTKAEMGRAVLGAKLYDGDTEIGDAVYNDAVFKQVYNDPQKGGGMTYIIRKKDGSFVIIDGGFNIDAEGLIRELCELHPLIGEGERFCISAWVITHTHDDHINLLKSVCGDDKVRAKLEIRRFYANCPSSETLKGRDDDVIPDNDFANSALADFEKEGCEVVRPYAGMSFECGELYLKFFYTQAEWATFGLKTVNDASLVFSVKHHGGKTAMMLGDIMGAGENIVLKMYAPEVLRADMVQVGHHALYGPSIEIYKVIKPKICFWPINLTGYGYTQYPKITERNNQLRALDCMHCIACFGPSQTVL